MPLSRDEERVVGEPSYGSAQQQQLESANQQLQHELARVEQELAATKARQQNAQATLSTQAIDATKVVLRKNYPKFKGRDHGNDRTRSLVSCE